MEWDKLIIIFILFVWLTGCQTTTPIVIEPVPKIYLQEDITLDDYLEQTITYTIKLKAYLDNIINQIKHKTSFIEVKDNTEDL